MIYKWITIHHSKTEDSGTLSWNAIRNYHVRGNKWNDIGYHFGLERIGNSYEILIGRTLDHIGAHVGSHNMANIGICCVGDFDIIQPDKELIYKLLRLLRWLCKEYHIPKNHIKGHRMWNPAKTCPGKLFDVDLIRRIL